MKRLLLLALLALLAAPLAADPPPPVNLGDTGLDVVVRLWHHSAATGTWTAADASAVTVTDLGTGEYLVDDLPPATGTERFRVVLALASDPLRELAGLAYGALPGTQVLWMPRSDSPMPHRFFVGDSSGTIGFTLRTGLPEAIADPGTTVTMDLVAVPTGTVLVDDAPADVASPIKDAASGTWGATLVHALAAGELTTPGDYRAYFTVTYAGGGGTRTLPHGGIAVTIAPTPGGAP